MAEALKYFAKVKRGGKVEIPRVHLKPGTVIEVIVLKVDEEFKELLKASESSMDFWNNSIDDRIWNDDISGESSWKIAKNH